MSSPPSATEFGIRPLWPADAQALGQFLARQAADPETQRFFHPFPLTAETARALCSFAAGEARRDAYFVATFGGVMLGLGMLRGWDAGYEVPSFGACVDPDARDAGVGRALLWHGIGLARTEGSPRMRLTVYRDNARAVYLYRQMGFVLTAKNDAEWLGVLDLAQDHSSAHAASCVHVDRLRNRLAPFAA